MSSNATRVLVVGAGPVGLALAGDLGWRGIDCLLIEQSDGAINSRRWTWSASARWSIAVAGAS
jgi:2-polyprenyl-6-methoxyphenol hydroxylase and related FAD-dependent oxidoreductases